MNKKWIIALWIYLVGFWAHAQDRLGADDAIRIALEHNYGILLVRNDKTIAENNASPGNAGMLPRVNLTGNRNFSINDSRQEFLTGQINERNNARSDLATIGAQLSWTIFDGFRMFRKSDQLRLLEKKAEYQELLAVEQLIQHIYNQYYSIALLESQLRFRTKSLNLSNERVRLAHTRLQNGSGSRMDLLQAQVDRNNDSSALYETKNQLLRARMQFNHILGRAPETPFTIADSIPQSDLPEEEVLMQHFGERNSLLRLARQDEQLAMLGLKEVRSRFYPEISTNVAYNYLNQQSEAGFLLINNTKGLTYGVTATWNLFNGLNNRREVQNYRIIAENSKLRFNSLQNELLANLIGMLGEYRNKIAQVALETQNASTAAENLRLAEQRFLIGDLSGIEYREAQKNELNAAIRLQQTKLEALLLEKAIRQMTGLLRP